MDGDTALKFIRSRHSADLEEGNDDARIRRQQLVLTSLMNQLMEKGTHFNPTFWGKLYLIWKTQVETDIPDSVLVGVGRSLIGKEVTHFQTQIPTQEGPEGLLENPPLTKYGAWVYEARDPTWEELHAWFTATLLE